MAVSGKAAEAGVFRHLGDTHMHQCLPKDEAPPPSTPVLEDVAEAASPPPDMALSLALRALPEQLRLPLVLKYTEGMSYLEIARVLSIPESTVRGRIARAKQQLRKELDA